MDARSGNVSDQKAVCFRTLHLLRRLFRPPALLWAEPVFPAWFGAS